MARGSPGAGALSAFEGFIMLALGLAVVAILVSKNAQTAGVFGATASGIAGLIGAATSPGGGSANSSAPHY
jgi:hypothetical protein